MDNAVQGTEDCDTLTQMICDRSMEPCCPPCDDLASSYLNCVVISKMAEKCPGVSCGNETNTTLAPTNSPTALDTNNGINNNSTITNNTSTTGVSKGNGTIPDSKTEIEERDGSGGIDVDGSTLQTAKLITERSSNQADSISSSSSACRYNNNHGPWVSFSVVAILVGIVGMAML